MSRLATGVVAVLIAAGVAAGGCSNGGKQALDEDVAAGDQVQEDGVSQDLGPGDVQAQDELAPEDVSPDKLDVGMDLKEVGPDQEDALPEQVDVGQDALPLGCCNVSADCEGDQICLPMPVEKATGTCVPGFGGGECYADSDCNDDMLNAICVGAVVCPCGVVCDAASQPGKCVPVGPGCCLIDAHCEPGFVCVGQYPGGGAGQCMPAPTGDECYDTEDCPENFFCLGAQECSCDMNCVSDPGTCAPLAGDCCFTNEECPDGYTCAESKMGGGPGVCEPLPPAGKCWNDEDCGGDFQFCKDAWACPCNADCDGLDKLGDCYCEPDACCCPALGCGAGMECVPVPGGGEACKPVPGAGMCWTDADCGADEACVGAIPCDCWWGEEGDGCDIPGSCIALPYDCCKTDQDCQAGFTCVGADMGGVCEPVPEPGKCWSDADCYMSQECVGMSFCPCGMECGLASMPGTCSPLPVGCCYTDKECGDGMECKGIWPGSELPGSCVPSHLGPACMGDAACCWDAADCNQYGDENGCIGASVCGRIALCPVCGACQPDQMGMCGI